jgi:hypothetical protein
VQVPADAVFVTPDGPVAFRNAGDGFERVRLTLGRRTLTAVEVTAGLAPGERVSRVDPGAGAVKRLVIALAVIDPYKIIAADAKTEGTVYGVGHQHREVMPFALREGRFIDAADEAHHAQVCVIGAAVRRHLEQTREIGVRRAVWARRADIRFQFLVTAFSLAILGGLLGVALGLAISRGVAAHAVWPTVVTTWSIAPSLGVSIAVGVASGLYPAMRAARNDPIEALHAE